MGYIIVGIISFCFLCWLVWFEYHDKAKHERAGEQLKSVMIVKSQLVKQCPNCNMVYGDSDNYCLKCNYPLKIVDATNLSTNEVENALRHEKAINNPSKLTIEKVGQIKCPYCGSTQIQIVKRGWKVTTGFIGSGKNERVCLNCMKKF